MVVVFAHNYASYRTTIYLCKRSHKSFKWLLLYDAIVRLVHTVVFD